MLANGKKLTNMILSNDVEKNSKVRYFLAMKILIVILTNVQFYSYCMNQGDRATYIPGPVRGKLEFEKPALENEEF